MARKIVSLISVLFLTLSLTTFVYADNTSKKEVDESEPQRYEDVCGGYPYHRMQSIGWGTVYKDGSVYIANGSAWKCKSCGRLMWTQGDLIAPGAMGTIGRYAEIYYGDAVANFQVVFSADYYGYTSSDSLQGYAFFHS